MVMLARMHARPYSPDRSYHESGAYYVRTTILVVVQTLPGDPSALDSICSSARQNSSTIVYISL